MRYLAVFLVFTFISCQHTKELHMAVDDITSPFQTLPPATKKAALENSWAFFSYAFKLSEFQKKALEEFPSLALFGKRSALIGKTPLDLRPLTKNEVNPIAILLAIDLEMEILSRFHSYNQASPRCLENFWSEWGLPLPRNQTALQIPKPATLRSLSQFNNIDAIKEVPLNENSKRLALYLLQSLGLNSEAPVKLLSYEEPFRAQFAVGPISRDPQDSLSQVSVYEIFSSPVDCKTYQEKKLLMPALGKMKCLQKQSATWVTVSAKEFPVLSDNWVSEVRQRCLKWVRPISDQLEKELSEEVKKSPLSQSWSFYPRLHNFVLREADRYENAFRKSL